MGELGPEVGWMSRNQRVGGQAGTRGWESREERWVGEQGPEVGWVSRDERWVAWASREER